MPSPKPQHPEDSPKHPKKKQPIGASAERLQDLRFGSGFWAWGPRNRDEGSQYSHGQLHGPLRGP